MHKLSEVVSASGIGEWVALTNYRQVNAFAVLVDADAGETVTVQLRKATDASGTNAADLGDPVTATGAAADTTIQAAATAYASELGETSGGVAYTHVSATVVTGGSPASPDETLATMVIRCDSRFSE